MICSLVFPENMFPTFHANCLNLHEILNPISCDNLHKMSKSVYWGKLEKYQFVSLIFHIYSQIRFFFPDEKLEIFLA